MKKFIFLFTLFCFASFAQNTVSEKVFTTTAYAGDTIELEYNYSISDSPKNFKSDIQFQQEYYSQFNFTSQTQWDSLYSVNHPQKIENKQENTKNSSCLLNKTVFGWCPYWISSTQYNNFDYSLLSDLSFFSYEVNATTGGPVTTHGWLTNGAVTNAQNAGCKVNLCATLFSNHGTFLNNSTAVQNFITSIISQVQQRNGNGVNIDFEGMGSANSVPFTNFMIALCNQMHNAIPGSQISIAMPAVDWSNIFDEPTLSQYVDLFVIMGYDYYWRGSANAGPVSPLNHGNFWNGIDCSRSMAYYLNAGIPKNKLALGVPYYGYDWATTTNALNSTTTAQGNAVFYYNAVTNAQIYGRQWNYASSVPYYIYNNSGWHQCFYDDEISLSKKYKQVNFLDIAGIGIWALGYDDGYTACWDAIKNNFTDCAPPQPCSDTITDFGGPGNYYNNENWTYTIAPPGAQQVSLTFSSFNVESNYDFLSVYDGPNINSPLIGTYTGTTNPGTLTANSGKMTLKFTSDGNTVTQGWSATWQCVADNTAPTTSINIAGNWQTANFNAQFNDADNFNGSGLDKTYYQVIDFDGNDWRANNAQGFFYDNFDLTTINSEWTPVTGNWTINNQVLEQSDENSNNTNIYAPLTQNLSDIYLYKWNGKITGSSNNRRAGFHFFSDNGSLPNRGNSYFVWFRVDQSVCEFYKVVNDVFTLQYSTPMTVVANQWYEYKVVYNRITGKIQVYQDNIYVGSWTDNSPYNNGQYVSFRSGNCNWQIDGLRIYRSRNVNSNELITLGNCPTCMIRYQNSNPNSPAAKIRSIVSDSANNFSTVFTQDVNVDWTAPDSVLVFDGTNIDIDTIFTNSQCDIFWNASQDVNSGINQYYYALGSTPGGTDVLSWTSNSQNLTATVQSLNLNYNQLYYASVKTENGAGLISPSLSSDGFIVLNNNSAVSDNNNIEFISLFPNPADDISTLNILLSYKADINISLYDPIGRKIHTLADSNTKLSELTLNISTNSLGLTQGIYIILIQINDQTHSLQLIKLH